MHANSTMACNGVPYLRQPRRLRIHLRRRAGAQHHSVAVHTRCSREQVLTSRCQFPCVDVHDTGLQHDCAPTFADSAARTTSALKEQN